MFHSPLTRWVCLVAVLGLSLGVFTGCKKEEPAPVSPTLEQKAKDVGEEVEDAAEAVGDAAKDAGEAVKDAAEDAVEKVKE